MRATIDGPATGEHGGIGWVGRGRPDAAPRHAGRDPTIPMGPSDCPRRPAPRSPSPAPALHARTPSPPSPLPQLPGPNPIRATTPFQFLSFSISDPT